MQIKNDVESPITPLLGWAQEKPAPARIQRGRERLGRSRKGTSGGLEAWPSELSIPKSNCQPRFLSLRSSLYPQETYQNAERCDTIQSFL